MLPLHLALLSCVCLIFSGCAANKKDEEEPKKKPDPPKLVGRVMSKPSKKNFVLIEYYGSWKYEDGTEFRSMADGRSACLVTSGEKLGPYIAADVESGVVDLGDAVFYFQPTPEEQTLIGQEENPPQPVSDPAEPTSESAQ